MKNFPDSYDFYPTRHTRAQFGVRLTRIIHGKTVYTHWLLNVKTRPEAEEVVREWKREYPNAVHELFIRWTTVEDQLVPLQTPDRASTCAEDFSWDR